LNNLVSSNFLNPFKDSLLNTLSQQMWITVAKSLESTCLSDEYSQAWTSAADATSTMPMERRYSNAKTSLALRSLKESLEGRSLLSEPDMSEKRGQSCCRLKGKARGQKVSAKAIISYSN